MTSLPNSWEALLCLILTCVIYFAARTLFIRFNNNVLLQPMLIATPVLILLLLNTNISLKHYQQGTQLLSWMLAPLTIALMVPLSEHIKSVSKVLPAILLTLILAGAFTVGITLLIAHLLGVNHASWLSLVSKSVTTPVALVISEEISALPSLAALIVIITGVVGVLFAPLVFKLSKETDPRAQGITLGLSAHIIGSAYAIEQNRKVAAYAIVSMSITAILSALLLPLLF